MSPKVILDTLEVAHILRLGIVAGKDNKHIVLSIYIRYDALGSTAERTNQEPVETEVSPSIIRHVLHIGLEGSHAKDDPTDNRD